jgi:hypothetical protein
MPLNINNVDMSGLAALANNPAANLNLPSWAVDVGAPYKGLFEGAKVAAQLDMQRAQMANDRDLLKQRLAGELERSKYEQTQTNKRLSLQQLFDQGQQQRLLAGQLNLANVNNQNQLALENLRNKGALGLENLRGQHDIATANVTGTNELNRTLVNNASQERISANQVGAQHERNVAEWHKDQIELAMKLDDRTRSRLGGLIAGSLVAANNDPDNADKYYSSAMDAAGYSDQEKSAFLKLPLQTKQSILQAQAIALHNANESSSVVDLAKGTNSGGTSSGATGASKNLTTGADDLLKRTERLDKLEQGITATQRAGQAISDRFSGTHLLSKIGMPYASGSLGSFSPNNEAIDSSFATIKGLMIDPKVKYSGTKSADLNKQLGHTSESNPVLLENIAPVRAGFIKDYNNEWDAQNTKFQQDLSNNKNNPRVYQNINTQYQQFLSKYPKPTRKAATYEDVARVVEGHNNDPAQVKDSGGPISWEQGVQALANDGYDVTLLGHRPAYLQNLPSQNTSSVTNPQPLSSILPINIGK